MTLDEIGPGRTFGSYEVLEELGRGGMGRVFRARHVTLERDVALKLLAEQFTEDEFYVQRFLKEARAAARLNHPGIVQIYDFGKVGAHWFLAMELVEGRSLARLLKTWGRFSEPNAVVVARQALRALAVAHAAGIVHRDVKPDNLILARKGVVKLVDLGLAKKLDDPGASSTGFAAGTPHYISPEQIEGRADVDGRADLYSLGATLFELVTGEVPFPGPSSAVVMSRHLNERPPDPRAFTPELSEAFSAAVLRLMSRDRDLRPRNAEEAERDFALVPSGAAPPRVAPPAPPAPRAVAADPASSSAETAWSNVPATPGPDPGPRSAPPASGPSLDPAASPTSTANRAFAASWDADVFRRVEEKLAARVGPLARLLVRNAARESADFDDLCRRLAAQIPDEEARPAFLRDVLSTPASSRPSGRSGPGTTPAPAARPPSHPSNPSEPGHATFPPALLALAEQRLAAEIGPLARVLVRREAKRHEGWSGFVEALAAQVPGDEGRRRLREALGPLGV